MYRVAGATVGTYVPTGSGQITVFQTFVASASRIMSLNRKSLASQNLPLLTKTAIPFPIQCERTSSHYTSLIFSTLACYFPKALFTPRNGLPPRRLIFELPHRLHSSSRSCRCLRRCDQRHRQNDAETVRQACPPAPRLFCRPLAGSRRSHRSRMQDAERRGRVHLHQGRHQPNLHRG